MTEPAARRHCHMVAKEKKPSYSRGIFTRLFIHGGFGKIEAAVSFIKEARIFA